MDSHKIKEELHDHNSLAHEMHDLPESHAEFEHHLMCTESLGTEEQFQANENASTADNINHKVSEVSGGKFIIKPQPPHIRRVNKPPPAVLTISPVVRDKPAKKSSRTQNSDNKRRQSRSRRSAEEPIIREVTVVDEQSVGPLSDVVGDLSFEDLELEDLDLVQHLPPPGNVGIIDHCDAAQRSLREFERKLQDVLYREGRGGAANEEDADSDATLSIISEDATGTRWGVIERLVIFTDGLLISNDWLIDQSIFEW